MASAVLANGNEPNWTRPQPRGGARFMGKAPFSNPNPKLSKKRQFPPAPSAVNFDGPPVLMQAAASDDASSISRRPPNDFNTGGYVTYNIASYSKTQLAELKNQFLAELEQIRLLQSRINSSELQIRSGSNFQNKQIVAPINKKISGNKRPFPASNFGFGVRDVKRSNHPENGLLMKKCGPILSKLMKHKFGYIFNQPVDVKGLQLHDYYDIIKKPMDLGTVKSKLSKNLYDSPLDFAGDVRLTFKNAMRYNPKGHEVYSLAEQQLSRFEELFRPIGDKLGENDLYQEQEQEEVQEVQASSWDHNPVRSDFDRVKKVDDNVMLIAPKYEPISKPNPPSGSNPQSTSHLPVRTPSPLRAPPPVKPVKPLKLPKPKAKEPNKRDMTLEEKHKLGIGLQSLPEEKMAQVVLIIGKRNEHLTQDGDEIELDIEAVDNETLWELDRFVTNYRKMASKMKRQGLMGVNNAGAAVNDLNKDVSGNEAVDVVAEAKKPKKGDAGDEDVDIGDEMPMSSFPPVEIERDNGHASSSSSGSSSSSDDSSSSDSDSGSSSGSDSEDAQS